MEFTQSGQTDTLWAGTIPDGKFYSQASGESWALNEPLWEYKQEQQLFRGGDHAGIHSINVHPDHSDKILIGVSCAGVWRQIMLVITGK